MGRARAGAALVGVAGALLAGPAPAAAGSAWTWPLGDGAPPAVVREYDPPATRYGAGHRGVDLAGAPGDVVRAAGAGRVSFAGHLAGRGVLVVVHGDLRTTYEPVRATVAVGAAVAAGEGLGTLDRGHPGCGAPACLHWGLRRGEEYLDPLSLVGRGPVRLLPLGASDGGRSSLAGGAPADEPWAAADGVPVAREEPTPLPATEQSTSLRSAVTPAAGTGTVVLLALLAVLRGRVRRRPRPRSPEPAPSATAPAGLAPSPRASALPAPLVDLARERAARRPAS